MSNYPKYEKYARYQAKKKPGRYQRFTQFMNNAKRILKIASKPSRKEYWLIFKICGIGLVVLGVLSYVIQLIFSVALPIGK
ncbi:MAG: protein translocase SEC61 complex subunit gamma [Candidatus Thorarchaeota archaeon]